MDKVLNSILEYVLAGIVKEKPEYAISASTPPGAIYKSTVKSTPQTSA